MFAWQMDQLFLKLKKLINKVNMTKENVSAQNLTKNLKQLSEITTWFDNQEEVDIEEGLKKVKQAAELIKISRKRLKSIENEFEEIKKDINVESEE